MTKKITKVTITLTRGAHDNSWEAIADINPKLGGSVTNDGYSDGEVTSQGHNLKETIINIHDAIILWACDE